MTKLLIATDMPDRLDKREEIRHILLVGMCELLKTDPYKALSIAEFLGAKKKDLAKIFNVDVVCISYAKIDREIDDSMFIPFGFVDVCSDFNASDVADYIVEQLKDFRERATIIMQAYKRTGVEAGDGS